MPTATSPDLDFHIVITTPPDPPSSDFDIGILSLALANVRDTSRIAFLMAALASGSKADGIEAKALGVAQSYADSMFPTLGIRLVLNDPG